MTRTTAYLEATESIWLGLQVRGAWRWGEAASKQAHNIGSVFDKTAVYLDTSLVSSLFCSNAVMRCSQFGSAHVRLANLLDEGGSKPYRHPQLQAVQLADKDLTREGVV